MTRWTVLAGTTIFLAACGGDPSGPSRPELAGLYTMTELRFDPQGVLPEVDLLERLEVGNVNLVLAAEGEAQLQFTAPATGLITTVAGAWSTPTGGVRVHFDNVAALRLVFLSPRMTFDHDLESGALRFDGEAPDGVDRDRLIELVPEWSGEQLLTPVPGRLVVELARVEPIPHLD
jgi:hypothetical protein